MLKHTEDAKGNTFKILAIDGGGIRGVVPAYILNRMKTTLGFDIGREFQMYAGTSTGSIIAAGIVCGVETSTILDLYKKFGKEIFSKNTSCYPQNLKPCFHSLYSNENLKGILKEVFGEKKLGEISKPLLIPATDIGNGGVHIFKSNYSEDFTRDGDIYIRDAVAASCSAPIFFNPFSVGEYLVSDGGLWANNPSLSAYIDAQKRLGIPAEKIKVFSLGTGNSKVFYGTDLKKNWGLINGWRGKDFISFILSLQSQATQNYLKLLINPENFMRLDFESDLPLPLDDFNSINDLLSRADKEFTYRTEDIKRFLKID